MDANTVRYSDIEISPDTGAGKATYLIVYIKYYKTSQQKSGNR